MRSNTNWFKDSKWGVFIHFLAEKVDAKEIKTTSDDWNRRVDAFDIEGLTQQLDSVGAKYCFITLGQCTGHYCTPNKTYDSIVGISPSKCAKRDLINDLYEALNARGIRLMVYLPSHAPSGDAVAVQNLCCTPKWDASGWGKKFGQYDSTGVDKRLSTFQGYWEKIIREWSTRWGKKVSGWWIDGCYYADRMYRYPNPPNFKTFVAAMKAGNPDSMVAFNPGVKNPVISLTEYEDYTAGEIAWDFPMYHPGLWPKNKQYHILSFLGSLWGQGEPRFPTEFVVGYTRHIKSHGGVVSWDVRINYNGLIKDAFLKQLRAIEEAP